MSAVVLRGDAAHLPLPDGSVDAVVCDPPYGLEFMGREWDTFRPSAARIRPPSEADQSSGRAHNATTSLVARNAPEAYVAGPLFQRWCEAWAAECLRVLKPGGHLLAFGGTRTWHRLVCGMEDAGFEIRDSVADLTGIDGPGLLWTYGSGFPKSLDVSKAVDKARRGDMVRAKLLHFAREHGIDGRWLEEHGIASASSFADWTTGGHVPSDANWRIVKRALEVSDEEEAAFERTVVAFARGKGTRSTIGPVGVGTEDFAITSAATAEAAQWEGWGTALKPGWEPIAVGRKPLAGTVAQNVLQYGTGALNVDGCRVVTDDDMHRTRNTALGVMNDDGWQPQHQESDGNDAGRWPPNVVLGEAAAAEMDRQSGALTSGANPARRGSDKIRDAYGDFAGQQECTVRRGVDSGGASRFFPVFRYEAKADTAERPRLPDGTAWPTVKPVALMQWLVRLVTPPGGTVLDCFSGTGTTGEACAVEGFDSILIDRDPQAIALTQVRLARMVQPGLFAPEDSAPAAPVRPVAASRPKPAPEVHPSLFDDLDEAG